MSSCRATNAKLIAALDPSIREAAEHLLELLEQERQPSMIVSGHRPIAEQDRLYSQGRTTPGKIVTHVRGGQSWHNYGLAFDLCPLVGTRCNWRAPARAWTRQGELGESLGLTWGGRWKSFRDLPHFQRTGGLRIADALRGERPPPWTAP